MNTVKIVLLIAVFPFTSFAQQHYSLSGTVIDSTNKPVEFANVILKDQNDKIVEGTTTSEQGIFKLKAQEGTYTLTISFLGYEDWSKEIMIDKNQDLGIITLSESENDLGEVVVTVEKPVIEKKVDRLVFNVENSIAASGGSALDALKVTPRIRVQNDQISMIGKSGISIMVDDRLMQLSGDDLINFLKTIRSDDIKSIEVITNPPVKYDAEGNSGIVNIKLKKVKQNSWSSTIHSSYKQAIYPSGTIGTGFNYQKNKVSIFSNISHTNGSSDVEETNTIHYPYQLWYEQNDGRNYSNSLSGKFIFDYKFSQKLTMGIQYFGSLNKPDIDEHNKTTLTNNATQLLDSLIITDASSDRKNTFNSINYHLIYDIDTIGKELSLDFDYFNYDRDDNRIFSSNNFLKEGGIIPNSFFSAQNIGNQHISNYSINIDVKHPLKFLTLNYGSKLSFLNTDNSIVFNDLISGVPKIDLSQSNQFKYKENVQSLYFSAHKELGKKWETKLGLRVENTQTEGNSITLNKINKHSYTEFFPTGYLSYSPNDNHSFSLNYGRRINRPSFGFLNPFRWYSSRYSFSEGNPALKPSFTHNIEFEYVYKNNWINSIYFSKLQDGYEYVTIVNSVTNTEMILAKNFIETNIFGLFESISFKPFSWFSTNLSMDLYYSQSKSSIPVTRQSLSKLNIEGSLSNDFILHKDKKVLFNISYIAASDGVDNLDENTHFSQLDASLKFLFLNKKLKLTLTANDIFSSNRPEYISFSNNLKTSFKNYYDDRFFRVSLIYDVGEKIKIKERRIKNKKEKERL